MTLLLFPFQNMSIVPCPNFSLTTSPFKGQCRTADFHHRANFSLTFLPFRNVFPLKITFASSILSVMRGAAFLLDHHHHFPSFLSVSKKFPSKISDETAALRYTTLRALTTMGGNLSSPQPQPISPLTQCGHIFAYIFSFGTRRNEIYFRC